MGRLLMGVIVLALASPAGRADEKPSKAAEELKKLEAEYKAALAEFAKEVRAAKSDEERQKLRDEKSPNPKFFKQFFDIAEKNAKDPCAIDALALALRASGGPRAGKENDFNKVIALLEKDHLKSEGILKVVRGLGGALDDPSIEFLRNVLANNPSRRVQARACEALAQCFAQRVEVAGELKADAELRGALEKALGKEFVEKLASGVDGFKKAGEGYAKASKEKYADVFPDLSVGKTAPEVISQDLDGKKVKLSDLRGKVVVLDIWATWCPPCRAMIPHERDMVKRLKDKPFVLVSISADEEKQDLVDFLKKEPMPWTHWWNGNSSGIVEDWNVEGFPTIFILDAKGVIRYRDLRGEKMEKAVEGLLEEMQSEKK